MEAVALKNFKSYRNSVLKGLNPHINIVIGANGQGKSNFFKALMFALSDKLSLNQTELNSCMHRGINTDNNSNIQVEVELEDRLKNGGNKIVARLAKVWTPKLKEELYINNKYIMRKQYESHIETLSLSYTNPYNIIQQGKIAQIILMDEFELYKLLEEVTGVKRFHKRKEEAIQTMNKVKSEKNEIQVLMKDISEKLQFLESRKEEFEYYSMQDKAKKYRTKKHLKELLESTLFNLAKLREQFSQILSTIAKISHKKEQIQDENQQHTIYIQAAGDKIMNISKNAPIFEPVNTQFSHSTQQIKNYEKELKKIEKELQKSEKQIISKNKHLSSFKADFIQIEKQYEKYKMANQLSGKPKQSRNKLVKAYEEQIKTEENKIKDLAAQESTLMKKFCQKETEMNSKHNLKIKKQHSELMQEVREKKDELMKIRIEWKRVMDEKNRMNLEVETLSQYSKSWMSKIRRMLPLIDTTLIDVIRKQNIKGVYGYFIDLVDIDQNLIFAYEIAGLNKLCSLLVEDQQVCNQVIQLNRKLKGKQINLIQLSYIRKEHIQKRVYPKNDKTKKMTSTRFIKPKPGICESQLKADIEKLINLNFGKYVLVEDYETGLQISKEYYLNCITSQKETIFSEGYLCKLGKKQSFQNSRIQQYNHFLTKKKSLQQKMEEYALLLQKQEQYQKTQIQLIDKITKMENQIREMDHQMMEVQELQRGANSIKKEVQEVQRMKNALIRAVENKKQYLKGMGKSKGKQNMAENGQKIEAQFNDKNKQLKKMLLEIYQIEERMQNLSQNKQKLMKLIDQQQQGKKENSDSIFTETIRKEISERQKLIQENERQIEQLENQQRNINSDKTGLEIKLTTYEEQYKDLQNKIEQIGEIAPNIEEEIEDIQNSMSASISRISAHKKRHHFSTNDKILFSKYASIIETFRNHKITYESLLQAEADINKLIAQYEEDAQNYMGILTSKFEKEFQELFGKLVEDGSAEVRFKKVSDKVKSNIRYRTCMSIRVNFTQNEGETLKKWNDFSGGQKTIIAITILLALQRCEPAPFYILDQIDSALDSVFVRKICSILAEESLNNNIQYFITSFKEEMLEFDEGICNYYLVKCNDRVSEIERVRSEQAKDALRMIVNN